MFKKIVERLEVLLEPQIDHSRFVNHYVEPVKYAKTKQPIQYELYSEDVTEIGAFSIKNTYKQMFSLDWLHKINNTYKFGLKTQFLEINLDGKLKGQESFVREMASLTSDVQCFVNEKGFLVDYDSVKLDAKWQALKAELKDKYPTEDCTRYLKGVEKKLNNKNRFVKELQQLKFFGLLFHEYLVLDKQNPKKRIFIMPGIHFLPIELEEQIENIQKTTNDCKVSYALQLVPFGTKNEKRFNNYLQYYELATAPLELSKSVFETELDTKTNYLNSARFTCILQTKTGFKKKIKFELRRKAHV